MGGAEDGASTSSQPTMYVNGVISGNAVNDLVAEQAHVSEIDVDDNGVAIGVSGVLWESFQSKQLRTICSRLSVRGVKNAKKSIMIDHIVRWYRNKQIYDAALLKRDMQASPTRKTLHCAFRLMNVLFSDAFAGDFATIGDVATRESLDSGKAGNEQAFWEKVEVAFGTVCEPPNVDFDQLHFTIDDDAFFGTSGHINPSIIVPHTWKKLRAIWKAVNSDYKAALSRFTVSGTHSSDFFSFCLGKLEPYYLRKHLEAKPQLNDMVAADLPDECFLSSEMNANEMSSKLTSTYTPSSSSNTSGSGSETPAPQASTRKRKTMDSVGNNQQSNNTSEMAAAIRGLSNGNMRSEVAEKKLRYLEKEDTRRDAEHEQQSSKYLFDQWEQIQSNIRLLRQDLLDKTIDDSTKDDLEFDIVGLLKKKEELSLLLGMR